MEATQTCRIRKGDDRFHPNKKGEFRADCQLDYLSQANNNFRNQTMLSWFDVN